MDDQKRTPPEGILRRVRGEFLEMPGLRLTSAQAQRLFGLDCATCAQLLESLVEERFLCVSGGTYARLSDGPVQAVLKASLDPGPGARAPQRSTAA
jgi:hypothetical protein